MKTCSDCKKEKSLDDFALNRTRLDGRQNICSSCKPLRDKEYYKRNKHRIMQRLKKNLRELKQKVLQYKAIRGCLKCTESDPVCLDFHHTDPNKKVDNIPTIIKKKGSWTSVLKEINKCQILCANCHRKLHAGI